MGLLTLCGTTAVPASRGEYPRENPAPPAESRSLNIPGPSIPLPGDPEYRPAVKLDAAQRITVPVAGIRADERPARDEKAVSLPDHPPDRRFFRGVFHRYRPRDPTPSQSAPS